MEKRQDVPSPGSGTPPGNFDIPTTIVLPTGLRRSRSRGGAASFPDDDLEAHQGLLDDDDGSDVEDEAQQRRLAAVERDQHEFEEFGELQEAPIQPVQSHHDDIEPIEQAIDQPVTVPRIFSIEDEDLDDQDGSDVRRGQ
ncbi:hypothetical protein Unana1_02861 [Umbelopsis nana]